MKLHKGRDSLAYIRVYVEAFLSVLAVREKLALLSWMIIWAFILLCAVREELAFCLLLVIFTGLSLDMYLRLRCWLQPYVILVLSEIYHSTIL